jgi:hypothetical protein
MGLVEGLALQAKAERQREKKRKCGERGEEDDGDDCGRVTTRVLRDNNHRERQGEVGA